MKKVLTSLIFITVVFSGHAQYYYDAYPITVTQTTNGTQYRLELSCYDSSLAAITTFNTAYYDTNYFDIDIGLVAYTGETGLPWTSGSCQLGAITYDHEIHQWKTYTLNLGFCPEGAYAYAGGGVYYFTVDPYSWLGDDYGYGGRYNIITHNFYTLFQETHDTNFGLYIDRMYASTSCGYSPDNEHSLYFNNYKNGSFVNAGEYRSGFFGMGDGGFNEVTSAVSDYNGLNWDAYAFAFDPIITNNSIISFENTDYFVDKSNYIFDSYQTYQLYYAKYDAAYHYWVVNSFPRGDIDSWVMGQNVLAFKNKGGNMVISAVYDFNKHRWEVDSTLSTQVDSLKITDGTVSWHDGSAFQQRGYNPLTGWNSNSTVLTPVFYAPDLSQPNGGNIIFIRDYSIGVKAGWWSNPAYRIDFGDGKTSNTSDDWHLYKKNGSYLYQGVPLTDTICYTVYSTADSATTCIPISCFSSLPTITSSLQYLCVGDTALLTATSGGLSYQWLHDGNPIIGSTNLTYSTTVQGKYQCMITDVCGVKYSNQLNIQNSYSSSSPVISELYPSSACLGNTNFQLQVNPPIPQATYTWIKDSIIIQTSSSNLSGTLPLVQGNYYCIITNNCIIDTTNIINIIISTNPIATIFNNGTSTICTGDSAELSVSTCNGCAYEWRKNGITISGAIDSLYYALSSGTYSCSVTDTTSGCFAISNNVNLNIISAPNVILTSNKPDTLCSNANSVTLSVGTPSSWWNTYNWRKNGAAVGGNIYYYSFNATSGLYDCIVTNLCGTDTSNSIIITIINPPQPVVTGPSLSLCPNSSMLLSVMPSNGYYYQWQKWGNNIPGATVNTYLITTAGNYSCVLTDSVCSASSPTYNVATAGNPTSFIIPLGPTSFCSPNSVTLQSNIAAGVTYQWFKNGIQLPGATSRNFVATTNGNYQVTNTNPITSCDSTSNPIIVSVPCIVFDPNNNGLPNGIINNNDEYSIYPTIFSKTLFLEIFIQEPNNGALKIFDTLGKEVFQETVQNNSGHNLHQLELDYLTPGIYFFEVRTHNTKRTFKLIKQ